jgi:hypothetical protein
MIYEVHLKEVGITHNLEILTLQNLTTLDLVKLLLFGRAYIKRIGW